MKPILMRFWVFLATLHSAGGLVRASRRRPGLFCKLANSRRRDCFGRRGWKDRKRE